MAIKKEAQKESGGCVRNASPQPFNHPSSLPHLIQINKTQQIRIRRNKYSTTCDANLQYLLSGYT